MLQKGEKGGEGSWVEEKDIQKRYESWNYNLFLKSMKSLF